MTDRFIDNFTPGDGSDGLTWAKAEVTAADVDAADAAGDRWLFDYRHSESTAGTITLAVAGTLTTPSQLLSVTPSGASGVSSLTAGAIIATTGANSIILNGSFYAYGLTFKAGSGSSSGIIRTNGTQHHFQHFKECTFELSNTNAGSTIQAGTGSGSTSHNSLLEDCVFKFNATGQKFSVNYGTTLVIRGGRVDSGGSAITTFATLGTLGSSLDVSGLDMSACATGLTLIAASANTPGRAVFRNCKLPASWSGSLYAGAPLNLQTRVEMRNCSAGDVNYALWVEDITGSIKHETTLVKSGGASDGTTPISWKMETTSSAEYPAIVLKSPEIAKWNETVGSSVTVTVDILHDSATNIQDDEIWLGIEYLGTSGVPLSLFASDAVADVLATPADQDSSSATWATTGMSNPNEQKLVVSFTPQEKGLIIARVCMAKASYTVYVDPELQIS